MSRYGAAMREKKRRPFDPAIEAAKLDATRDAMIERVDQLLSQPAEAPAALPHSRVRRRRRRKD